MGRSKVVAWFCSVEKVFCDIFQNSKGNNFAGVSFLIKVHTRPVTLLKNILLHRCFPLNFEKSHRAPFYRRRTTASGRWHILNNYWKLKEIHHKKIYLIIFNNFSRDIRILWNLWTIQISYLLLISDFVTFLEESVIRKSKLFCKKRCSGL